LLPDLIRAFEKEAPQIAVHLLIRQVEDILEFVAGGSADIGMAGGLDRFPLPEHLSLNCWVEQSSSLLAGGGLPQALTRPVIVYMATRDATMPSHLRQRLEELGIFECELRTLPSTEAVKGACLAGLGYALIPRRSAALELQTGLLREVPGFTFPGQVWVCQPLEEHQSAAARAFLRYLHGAGVNLALAEQVPQTVQPAPAITGGTLGDLSGAVWERIEPLLPSRLSARGRPRRSDRSLLEGMLWVQRNHGRWRDLPECYGPWQTVYGRYALWRSTGIWDQIERELHRSGAIATTASLGDAPNLETLESRLSARVRRQSLSRAQKHVRRRPRVRRRHTRGAVAKGLRPLGQ
jgi:transposase